MNMPKKRVGTVKQITSLANPIIKDIKGLTLKKNRDATDRFIAEGLKLVMDGIEQDWPIDIFIYAAQMADNSSVQQTAAKVVANSGLVLVVSEKVLAAITRRDNPQMVVGIFKQIYTPLTDFQPQQDETYIALDRVRDPGNLGTIIRTADAAGIKGVILVGQCTDPFSVETVRATMGSIFHMKLAKSTIEAFQKWQNASDTSLIGSHLQGSVDFRTIDYRSKPTILLMGNEQSGLPDDLSQRCDQLARIPQVGRADSLNLAVASALMIFEARRHRLELD